MVSSMQQILPIVWNTLTESAALYPLLWCRSTSCCFAANELMMSLCSEPRWATHRRRTSQWFLNRLSTYVRTEVNYTEEVDDPVDSDGELNRLHAASWVASHFTSLVVALSVMSPSAGEVLGFENLVFSIFDFVHTLLENNKFKSTVKKALPDLIYYIILYMQITEEQVRTRPLPRELRPALAASARAFYCQNWLPAKCSHRSKCGQRTRSSLWRTRTTTLSPTRSGFLPRICWWWDTKQGLSVGPWSLEGKLTRVHVCRSEVAIQAEKCGNKTIITPVCSWFSSCLDFFFLKCLHFI